jgi:putative intracellular protease/amidase
MQTETIIVTLYPGCISFEVALAAELLSKKFKILNATPDGKDLTNCSGLALKAHLSYAEVNLENCRAILVPGGNPDSIIHNTEIDRILRLANTAGLLIGAICAGPSVLAKAGILKGRKIAHGYGSKQLNFLKDVFSGVILTNDQIVVEGNIITAKPEAHIDFAVEIGCRLGALDADRSAQLKEYYRGKPPASTI